MAKRTKKRLFEEQDLNGPSSRTPASAIPEHLSFGLSAFPNASPVHRSFSFDHGTPIHQRDYDNTEDYSDSPIATSTPGPKRPHADSPSIPIGFNLGGGGAGAGADEFRLSSMPFAVTGSPLTWSGSECGSNPATPPSSPGRNSTNGGRARHVPATPTPIKPKYKPRSPAVHAIKFRGDRFGREEEEEDQEQQETPQSQDVEMTEAEDVSETPRDTIPEFPAASDCTTPEQPRGLRQAIELPVPTLTLPTEPQQQQVNPALFSPSGLPMPTLIFAQPKTAHPAPPPTQYKSDTEAARRAHIQQRGQLPSLVVTSHSDSSPQRSGIYGRSNRATLMSQLDEMDDDSNQDPNEGNNLFSFSNNNGQARLPLALPGPTPLKVLHTNVNPWSPDVRKTRDLKFPKSEHTPRVLEDFENLRSLGSGSFGEVFLGLNRIDGWKYAVKKIRYRNSIDKQRCLNEVYFLAAMGAHPNLIRYHSSWIEEDDMTIYMVTEYCNRGSLKQYAAEKAQPFTEAELCDILRQVAAALDYLHETKGVAHLDVKPENILVVVDESNPSRTSFKLGDFGLIAQRQMRNSNSQGTSDSFEIEEGDSRYLPRELLDEDYDHALLARADIFALAMSIWELAVRQPMPKQGILWKDLRDLKPLLDPFNRSGANSISLTQSVAASVEQWPLYSLPSYFSPQFRQLLISMLSPHPQQRPTARKVLEMPILNCTPLERIEMKRMLEAQENKILMLRREMNRSKAMLRRRESFSGTLTSSAPASPPLFDSQNSLAVSNNFIPLVPESVVTEVLKRRLGANPPFVDIQSLASEIAAVVQIQIQQQQFSASLRSSSPTPRVSGLIAKENLSPTSSENQSPTQQNQGEASCFSGSQNHIQVLKRSSTSVSPQGTFAPPGQKSFLKRAISDLGF